MVVRDHSRPARAFQRTCAFAVIGRLGAAATLRQCQPSERDLTGACAARLVAVLSARSAGRSHPPCQEGRRPSPPSHSRSRSGSRSGSTPTAMSMSPTPPTSSAATWPRRASRPRRGAIGRWGTGPADLARWQRSGWKGPAGMGPGWLASWASGARWWLSQPAGPPSPPPAGKSDPVDAEAAARAVVAGQATAIPRPATAWSRWCGAGGGQSHGDAGPHPGRQCAAGAGGHRPVGLGEQPRDLDPGTLAATAARLGPGAIVTSTAATKLALGTVAERQLALTAELPRWMPNWTG